MSFSYIIIVFYSDHAHVRVSTLHAHQVILEHHVLLLRRGPRAHHVHTCHGKSTITAPYDVGGLVRRKEGLLRGTTTTSIHRTVLHEWRHLVAIVTAT